MRSEFQNRRKHLDCPLGSFVQTLSVRPFPKLRVYENSLIPHTVIGPVKHSENEWRRIKIGNVYEYLAKPLTSRKEMPDMTFITAPAQTTDQTHNVKLQFTRKPDIAEKSPITCLGMLLIPLSSDSVIKVGDEIRVLRREGDPEETQQSSIRHTYSSLSSLPAPRKYF